MADAYFAESAGSAPISPGLPNSDTVWTLAAGRTLVARPAGGADLRSAPGLTFTRTIAVDAKSMFTITDTVTNTGAAPVDARALRLGPAAGPAGRPRQAATSSTKAPIGVLGLDKSELRLTTLQGLEEEGRASTGRRRAAGSASPTSTGWPPSSPASASGSTPRSARRPTPPAAVDVYEATYLGAPRADRRRAARSSRSPTSSPAPRPCRCSRPTGKSLGAPRFDDAVDWGIFWFLTKPIFLLLEFFYQHVGNFGVAILLLTVVIRLIIFPLANKQLRDEQDEEDPARAARSCRSKHKDDPAKQQKEMMALYPREKVNPLTGCLPMLSRSRCSIR